MANIQRRKGRNGSVAWRAQVRLRGFPPQTATFASKTDAVNWSKTTEVDLRAGRHFPAIQPSRRTLTELLDRYRQEVLPHYNPREQRERARKLDWWAASLGTRPLTEVTPAAIAEARLALAKGKGLRSRPAAPATQARYLAVLRHAFSIAVREWEWATENPVRRIKPPREPRGRVRFLSEDERDRLLHACEASYEPRLYPLVVLALSTGARLGELLRLRWRDIDLARGVAILHETKNRDRRSLPLAGRAHDLLRRMSRNRPATDAVFAGKTGAALFPRKVWEAALAAADIPDFRFHDLRHTAASYLAMSGATLAEIADVLGHRTLQMVKRYAHLAEQHTTSVVTRMNARFLGDG
jgi:integrase